MQKSIIKRYWFPLICLWELTEELELDADFFINKFGIWGLDEQVLNDLANGNSARYVEEFRQKRIEQVDSEWFQNHCQDGTNEMDVQAFFDEFHDNYETLIRTGLLFEFMVFIKTYKDGYSRVKVLPPAFMLN
ncbi:hypothetical protein [Siphonobacter sp. SORGH_AS_1065]|uniref:hypothetical protein n=1 Tax=Siphonobacter sp. SORGH_AS_1065 TaxID=3041795 RepID=UPI002787E3E1|nr:hypothetical protein [Siphonobacter sp. SORGH_AS_1065]MDQ1087177.1 hypothetical protein [Siphonobacter sp. SORGH_AS_1065]